MTPNDILLTVNRIYRAISSVGQSTCLTSRGSQVRVLYRPPLMFAEIAQLVEQLTCNQQVTGSIPVFGTIFFGRVAKWSNAADCKSVPSGSMVQIHLPPPLLFGYRLPRSQAVRHHTLTVTFVSSNLAGATTLVFIFVPLAQSVEHLTFNQRVTDSNSVRDTIFCA